MGRSSEAVQVAILCGGRGTRLREQTEALPKALVEVGGKPILWHVLNIYSAFGFNNFVLCLGHMGDRIKQYFVEYHFWRRNDFFLRLGHGFGEGIEQLGDVEPWNILFADTGLDTNTGGRLKRIEPHVAGDTFFVTYADGLANIDLMALLSYHRQHGRIATVTAVNPVSNFGLLEIDASGLVRSFREKPRLDAWTNGGFFVFDRRVFDYLDEDSILERGPLERLAAEGQLCAYTHGGFWRCMDTYKETLELNDLWASGSPPWKVW